MFLQIVYVVIFASSVLSRHVPDINELDDEDHILFRAAYESSYDTPSYNQPSYNQYNNYEDDMKPNKLDLFKDGIWVIKSKIIELKAINKALAANMLMTKMKLKELMLDKFKSLKVKPQIEIEKKPAYNYQPPPPPPPAYPQYEQHSNAPPQQYEQHYNVPPQQYEQHYNAPQYAPPAHVHDPYYGH